MQKNNFLQIEKGKRWIQSYWATFLFSRIQAAALSLVTKYSHEILEAISFVKEA